MQTTTTYEFGDVVLVPFPFSDISTSKQRPAAIVHSPRYEAEALVVSSDRYNIRCPDLIIVIGITSTDAGRQFGSIPVESWKAANLLHNAPEDIDGPRKKSYSGRSPARSSR